MEGVVGFISKLTDDVVTAIRDPRYGWQGPIAPDPVFASKKVVGLDGSNFDLFLKKKDFVMVMFYDNVEPSCPWFMKHFNKAAEKTNKAEHVYAAVNCDKDSDFCLDAEVTQIPNFQIYYKGQKMTFFKPNLKEFQYKDMQMWIEHHSQKTPRVCKSV